MRIRLASAKDIRAVVPLWQQLMDYHLCLGDERVKHLKPDAAARWKSFVRAIIATGTGALFVAEENGSVIGYCLASTKKNIPLFFPDTLGYISDLCVSSRFRGRGIGGKLLAAALAWLRQKKQVAVVELAHHIRNRNAGCFYQKAGFKNYSVVMRKNV